METKVKSRSKAGVLQELKDRTSITCEEILKADWASCQGTWQIKQSMPAKELHVSCDLEIIVENNCDISLEKTADGKQLIKIKKQIDILPGTLCIFYDKGEEKSAIVATLKQFDDTQCRYKYVTDSATFECATPIKEIQEYMNFLKTAK